MFNRSLINVRLGHMGKGIEGHVAVKLAEARGKICKYDEAEKMFAYGIKLIDETYGLDSKKSLPARMEFAQFLYDLGKYEEFVSQLKVVNPLVDEDMKAQMPKLWSDHMKVYSDVLLKVGETHESALAYEQAAVYAKIAKAEIIADTDLHDYPTECT